MDKKIIEEIKIITIQITLALPVLLLIFLFVKIDKFILKITQYIHIFLFH